MKYSVCKLLVIVSTLAVYQLVVTSQFVNDMGLNGIEETSDQLDDISAIIGMLQNSINATRTQQSNVIAELRRVEGEIRSLSTQADSIKADLQAIREDQALCDQGGMRCY